MIRCSRAATGEPLAGSAPAAGTWLVVEHPEGWGDAPLARSGHGVRVLMARGPRGVESGPTRVWVAHTGPEPVLRVGTVGSPEEVARWALDEVAGGALRGWGETVQEPLLVVCANGRRDRCCGHDGGRLASALWQGPHARQVLTGSHLGGHRFAPTALLLPHGALYGRLDEAACTSILTQAERGRLPAEGLRGFSSLTEPAQVADALVRAQLGIDAPGPLPVQVTTDGQRATARVGLHAASLEVLLERRTLAVLASCGKGVEPLTRWVAADVQPGLAPRHGGL